MNAAVRIVETRRGPRLTIGGVRRDLVRAAFCDYFGIGDVRADLLIALYEHQGQPADWSRLRYGVDTHRRPTTGALQESISILRACMKSEAIDRNEIGYFLSEVGLGECREALLVMASTLASVGAAFPDDEPDVLENESHRKTVG